MPARNRRRPLHLPHDPPFYSTDEIAANARAAGSHFFDADTLRFFSSRIGRDVIGRRFFVTSERRGFDDYRRAFTIRCAMPDGTVETVGGFLTYETGAAARRALRRAMRDGFSIRPTETEPDPRHFHYVVTIGGLPIGPPTTLWRAQRLRRALER